jgi:predicted protein tyrosine phosphatase
MMRSPTAEDIYKADPRLKVKSAGVERSAVIIVDSQLLEWADLIFVMEQRQLDILESQFPHILANEKVFCLNIPDEYEYMEPELVSLLKDRVEKYLIKELE